MNETLKNIVVNVLIPTILSGVLATIITLWWQNKSEKTKIKREIFTILMAYRFEISNAESVKALNCVQAVFHDNKNVCDAWLKFKNAADKKPFIVDEFNDAHTQLLEEIAKSLNYKGLNWKDVKCKYFPVNLADEIEETKILRKAQLEVTLRNANEMRERDAQNKSE